MNTYNQPDSITVDIEALRKVFGYQSDFEFWGFYNCYYILVQGSIERLWAQQFNEPKQNPSSPKRLAIDITINNVKQLCKTELVNFVYENAARVQEGNPIAKIIFCLARDEDQPEFSIYPNYRMIAESHSVSETIWNTTGENHITDAELRRCFKLCFEADPRIQKIARDSFAFAKLVRVKEQDSDKPYYTFVELKPFWENEEFKQYWLTRKRHTPKNESWSTILTKSLDRLYANQTATLFTQNPSVPLQSSTDEILPKLNSR